MRLRRTVAALLAALLALGLTACGQAQTQRVDGPPERGSFGKTLLAGADYPEMARYPDETVYEIPQGFDDEGYDAAWSLWWADDRARRDAADAYRDAALTDALARLIPQLMTGEGTAVCSPLDVYLALALLADATAGAAAFVLAGGAGTPSRSVVVDLALPRFDVTAERDLTGDLRALGVTDVLDPDRADLSPLLPEGAAALGRATHAARVAVDE